MNSQMYFLPSRVIEEYKTKISCDEILTAPIIKRRISAMIYATRYKRKKIGENLFEHQFGSIQIVVEEDTKTVRQIDYKLGRPVEGFEGRYYGQLCKFYRLNDKRNNFSPLHIHKKVEEGGM